MKKSFLKNICFYMLMGILTVGACTLFSQKPYKVKAATLSGIELKEDFSSKSLSEQWLKNGYSLDDDSYYSMRFDNQTEYGSAMLYYDYKIHDDCLISFDFYQSKVVTEKAKDNWFGILLGYNEYSAHFTNGNAALLFYGRGQTQMMDDGNGTSEKLVADSYNNHTKFSNSFNKEENVLYTVELQLTYTGVRYSDGENLYRVDGFYYEKSQTRGETPQFTYKGIAADGYFGFSAMSHSVLDISNLQVIEQNQRVVYENFEDEKGLGKKLLPNYTSSVWHGINLSEVKVYNYFNGRIDLSKNENGLLLSNYVLNTDNLNLRTFTLSFVADIKNLSKNSSFGVALGLNGKSVSVEDGEYIALQGSEENCFEFIHIRNGEIVDKTTPIPQSVLLGKNTVRCVGYYDGTVEITVGGYTASFENAVKNGYIGFATWGNERSEVFIDDIQLQKSTYVSSTATNQAINFTGVKETVEDDYTIVERYINEKKWYLGAGVAFPKVFNATPYIQFTNANERTCFGSKQTYSEFICRFSITVTQNRKDTMGSYIGLSFGKENRNDYVVDSPSLLFGSTEEGMIVKGYHCNLTGANGNGVLNQYETYPELDFWSSQDWKKFPVRYRVTVVVRGGNAYLYYANEADLSDMNVCKAVATGMETSGYVTLSALGGASFRLNDFSITNISLQGKVPTENVGENEVDSEYVNVDFKNETLYSVTGTATMTEKGISLGYSSQVDINEKFTDFLAYVDVRGVAGEAVEIKVGENRIRLNTDDSVYSDMTLVGGECTYDFSALKNGGVVMLERLGNNLKVSIVGNTQPEMLLETPIACYQTTDTAVRLSVSTVGETVLSLEGVRLYTLKPTIAITADNWRESDTELPEKEVLKKQENTNKNSGNKSVALQLIPVWIAVGVICIATGIIILWKKKEKHNENEK